MGAAANPGRPTGDPSPNEDRPSPRVALAAWMLRNGDDPDRVAAITDVPFALVELIAEHLPPRDARLRRTGPVTRPLPADRGLETGGNPTGGGDPATTAGSEGQQARHRRVRRILRCAVICLVVNAALCVVATLLDADTVAAVCLTALPLSYAVVLSLQLLLPSRTPPRHRRR